MTNFFLTGASGFVGSRLLKQWSLPNEVIPISVRYSDDSIEKLDWSDVDSIIHLSGLAHQSGSISEDSFDHANHLLTAKLASVAKEKGVRNFIFASTIKVYGNHLTKITDESKPNPDDAYGKSKLLAEEALTKLSDEKFNVSILRFPLIVGPGAKGNLYNLMKLLSRKLILPFSKINNCRSMLALDELILIIESLVKTPQNGIFLLSTDTISTTSLATKIREEMGFSKTWFYKLPDPVRKLLRRVKPGIYSRLFGDLVMESKSQERIKIDSSVTLDSSISEMVKAFNNLD